VTGRSRAVVRDFTLYPHIGVLPLDVIPHLAHQLAYPPHPPEAGRSFGSNFGKNQSKLAS
jgi:hypothetical protein